MSQLASAASAPSKRDPDAEGRAGFFSRERWRGIGSLLRSPALLTLAPLTVVIALFFVLPIVGMAIIAFTVDTEDGGSTVGIENFLGLGSYADAIVNSILVSAVGSVIAAVIGALTAFCISQIRSQKLDSVVAVLSSVLANDGGAPLAFSFIVTLGNTGVVYTWLNLSATSFSLYSWQGLVIMYQYFLIPTMVMVTLPTFAGLRGEWKEANVSLGGGRWTFWRRVGLPVATPALFGGWILLFGSAFATYASAAVLIGTGGFQLIPLTIASELRSGAGSGGESAAMALGVAMVVIAVAALYFSTLLQKRSSRWLQ